MPQYRLLYFNLRGRAEPIRWILKAAGEPFEDVRFDRETEWPHKKADTPYGKVPVLFVDGEPLCQSVAICRYLGRRHALAPEDPWEEAVGDEVADTVHDLLPPAAQIIHAKIAHEVDRSKKLATEFYTSILPPVMRGLERRLEGRRWFCGGKMTWVDIFVACYVSQLGAQNESSLAAAPNLKRVVGDVRNLPAIQKWLSERPDTPM